MDHLDVPAATQPELFQPLHMLGPTQQLVDLAALARPKVIYGDEFHCGNRLMGWIYVVTEIET